jgi:hypothetical protein
VGVGGGKGLNPLHGQKIGVEALALSVPLPSLSARSGFGCAFPSAPLLNLFCPWRLLRPGSFLLLLVIFWVRLWRFGSLRPLAKQFGLSGGSGAGGLALPLPIAPPAKPLRPSRLCQGRALALALPRFLLAALGGAGGRCAARLAKSYPQGCALMFFMFLYVLMFPTRKTPFFL